VHQIGVTPPVPFAASTYAGTNAQNTSPALSKSRARAVRLGRSSRAFTSLTTLPLFYTYSAHLDQVGALTFSGRTGMPGPIVVDQEVEPLAPGTCLRRGLLSSAHARIVVRGGGCKFSQAWVSLNDPLPMIRCMFRVACPLRKVILRLILVHSDCHLVPSPW